MFISINLSVNTHQSQSSKSLKRSEWEAGWGSSQDASWSIAYLM